ncbi:hypothetical protein PtA15_11A303 [Puccinia triticina]|uniref:Uncharacterized protein n=1 Tax=Puccinia triticina TaxID=208348 RepID=A0ABY7CXH6_9BASI|nr:uncharacterized protein PtA15_11A303 [Puccinia triticina]WAQ89613.1 hypothetical protein PtA15_11A303 [Puccinia triticina]
MSRSSQTHGTRLDHEEVPDFTTAHPAFLTGGANTPVPPGPRPNDKHLTTLESIVSPKQLTAKGRMTQNFNSGVLALKRVVDVLKKKKERKVMAKNSSPSAMNRLQEVCHALLQSVEDRLAGFTKTVAPAFPGISNTSRMNGAKMTVLIGELVEVGWAALKRMDDLLKVVKNSKEFVSKSDEFSVALFREQLFEVVGVLEEGKVLAPRVQIR